MSPLRFAKVRGGISEIGSYSGRSVIIMGVVEPDVAVESISSGAPR